MRERLHKLKVYNLYQQPQTKCINMLVNTMHSYIPLQANHNRKDLINFDNSVLRIIKKSNGLTTTDIKHHLFLPTQYGGIGLTSAMEIDLISVARELEIVSNSADLDSFTFRTRIAAIKRIQYNDKYSYLNHARDAIRKLAYYGIHFRDSCDGFINDILDYFCTLPKYAAIGHPLYSNGNGHSIGMGKECNQILAYGGPAHELLLKIKHNNWQFNRNILQADNSCHIKINAIEHVIPKLQRNKLRDITRLFECWEWTSSTILTSDSTLLSPDVPNIQDKWLYSDLFEKFKNKPNVINWNDYTSDAWNMIIKCLSLNTIHDFMLDTSFPIQITMQKYNKYAYIFNYILRSKSPIIIATDGSLKDTINNEVTYKCSNSAFTMGVLNIKEGESITSAEWTERPIIPLLCRISALPSHLGNSDIDISIAECHAFLMEEMCIPTYFPRIIITDSEAVRDQVLYARDTFNGDVNRKFIRSNIGGISKCVMSNLANLINNTTRQKEITASTNNNSALRNVISILTERNVEFLNIAKTWTVAQVVHNNDNLSDETDLSMSVDMESNNEGVNLWRTDYFDQDVLRPILKVNSHQLDDTGSFIKNPPRYTKLIPNYCLLQANHIADVLAEFPFHKTFQRKQSPYTKIQRPISPLRFSLSMNGNVLDKHVNGAIRDAIFKERLKRICTKATQGLLWRLMDHISDTWASLRPHKGLLRSLCGLSRTHTRSLYKSSIYRDGCYFEYLQSMTSQSKSLSSTSPGLTVTNKINMLKQCTWCKSGTSTHSEQGNRMHAFLRCTHPDLTHFRTNIDKIIIQEIQSFLQMIQHYDSSIETIALFQTIQHIFLEFQFSQTGRLRKLPESINNSYIATKDLLIKHNAGCIIECAFQPSSTICLELFGLLPNNLHKYHSDAHIGVVDAPWLGLIPKKIDECIIHHIHHIEKRNIQKPNKIQITKDLLMKWDLIKGLILGKAIGLHRITGIISSYIEKNLQNRYNLEKGTRREIKKKIRPTSDTKNPKVSHNHQSKASTNLLSPQRSETYKNICMGISCNNRTFKWDIFKAFQPNRIKSTIKHCTRCAKYCTIIKLGCHALHEIQEHTENTIKKFVLTLTEFSISKPSYHPLMNLLNSFLPITSKKHKASYKNRNKISDQHKNLCKVLSQTFTNLSNNKLPLDSTLVVKQMHANLLEKISFNSTHLAEIQRKSKIRHQTIETILHSPIIAKKVSTTPRNFNTILQHKQPKLQQLKSPKQQQQIITIDDTTQHKKPDTIEEQEINQRRIYLDEALNDNNGMLSSMAIMRAIEVFRHEREDHHFFATAETSSILESWQPTEGWERAARIFGSRTVLNEKPDGFYFLPIFGDNHWTLAIVQKIGRYKTGTVIDSLGASCSTSAIHDKINAMFIVGGGHFDWNCVVSIPQMEMECGLRVIIAIARITSTLKSGETLETGIRNATLQNEFGINRPYNSMIIRREAADIIGRFRNYMWTGPVGIRINRGNTLELSVDQTRKRKRRRRRK